jgi:hypothetical protein
MKRSLCFGFMAFMASGITLFGAQPAHAQVQCYNVPGTSVRPYNGYTQYCGTGTLSDGANMATVLRSVWQWTNLLGGNSTSKAGQILSIYNTGVGAPGARFWVFGAPAEYSSYCNANNNNRKLFGIAPNTPCPVLSSVGTTYGNPPNSQ